MAKVRVWAPTSLQEKRDGNTEFTEIGTQRAQRKAGEE